MCRANMYLLAVMPVEMTRWLEGYSKWRLNRPPMMRRF